jgi:(p)ppGpp synthase/HD superfamily hydrolase
MTKSLNIEFEKAVRLLAEAFPVSDENTRKPVLFHDIRVGVYLYENNYSREIILAGILHDALEFSSAGEELLREEFGDQVLNLVYACTKDDSIEDPQEKTNELISRCAECGEDALIVKTADILDSFKYYTATENPDQLEYCLRNAKAIMNYKPDEFKDKIFDELKKWL